LDVPGYAIDDCCQPTNYDATQAIAAAARSVAEALLAPSCTRFPEGNLIIFPDRLHPDSRIVVEETVASDLYIDWDAMDN
jgi:hypothetical protein